MSVYGTYPIWEKCGFATQPPERVAEKLAGYGETARYMISRLERG